MKNTIFYFATILFFCASTSDAAEDNRLEKAEAYLKQVAEHLIKKEHAAAIRQFDNVCGKGTTGVVTGEVALRHEHFSQGVSA